MRRFALTGLVICMAGLVQAGELRSPPTLPSEPTDEAAYLRQIYQHHNNLVVVTSNPNGSRRGLRGDVLFYNNGGSYKHCVNTDAGPAGGTTWVCAPSAYSAP